MAHCQNNAADRSLGAKWERNFCRLAAETGKMFTPHQLRKSGAASAYRQTDAGISPFLLPDITVWTAPGEHHEIKHKNPTRNKEFGLEQYRFDALKEFSRETKQVVYYTIHNWELVPDGRDSDENDIDHWVTASIGKLYAELNSGRVCTRQNSSYVNGQPKLVPIHYWKTSVFVPLKNIWYPGRIPVPGTY